MSYNQNSKGPNYNIDLILSSYTRKEISEICGVEYRTVLNWISKKTIPLYHLEKLGFNLDDSPYYLKPPTEKGDK